MTQTKNFLFVSIDGLIGDIAWRVSNEGHNVRYSIETDYAKDIVDGLVPKTNNWRKETDWADLIVFDDTWGGGEFAENLRKRGKTVIGGSVWSDRLEEDRSFAKQTMKDLGMQVIEGKTFTSFEKGIQYIENHPNSYVFKPCGEVQNYKDLLYVGRDPEGRDVINLLHRHREQEQSNLNQYQLQKRVDGIEISLCGFFNGQQFLEPVNYTFEHKPLFPGGIGPMTGEMGTSMFWTEKTTLFQSVVEPFSDCLRAEGYAGPFDVNCIVTRDEIYPLEVTPRFGYPQIAIQEEGLNTPISELLLALGNGNDPDLDVHSGYQVGARVVVPPFPYDDLDVFENQSRDAPIWFEGDGIPKGVHPEDLKYTDGKYRVAGETGEILVVTGKGDSMRAAQEEMYDRIDRITLPNMYYRNDIGDHWYENEEGEKLRSWGYL